MRDVLTAREPENFNWNDTWLAEMFRSGEISEQRKLEMERRMGITPEVKRYNEIKAGVITSSAGIGVAVFLHIFMQGIAAANPESAEILTRIWTAGAIPFFVGLALIINGLVVSKRQAEIMERELKRIKTPEAKTPEPQMSQLGGASPRALHPADTNEFVPTPFSVTDQTTRHLVNSEKEPKR
ncbi:MAG TPA: hypothetical protein VFS77_20000 [Pyrinomonadaceae bacterium]|nr:hypothetical protein [Pyrinomonadaceae bacterium]